MAVHPTVLSCVATGQQVGAELDDALSLADLRVAEEQWAGPRRAITEQLRARSITGAEWPQSLHWDWGAKASHFAPYIEGPFSSYRLFGLRAEGQFQGLLLASCVGHRTRLHLAGRDLVYVEFVETAPWNWPVACIGQPQRLKGVGLQLVELAIRWSVDLEYRGRLGLHALPQAESFYRGACHMTDMGPDAGHQSLHYLELDEPHAQEFLKEA